MIGDADPHQPVVERGRECDLPTSAVANSVIDYLVERAA